MIREKVSFRLIQMPCCGFLFCNVNPRLPTYCPECGTFVLRMIRSGECTHVGPVDSWLVQGELGPQFNDDQVGFLKSLVRVSLRKNYRGLERLKDKFGAAYKPPTHEHIAFIEGVYRELGGDPANITNTPMEKHDGIQSSDRNR